MCFDQETDWKINWLVVSCHRRPSRAQWMSYTSRIRLVR